MDAIITLLNKKTEALPFSNELKSILLANGITSLKDLLREPVKVWMTYDSFNYHHLKEITGFVQENGLVDYLKH
jgi:hypothetical protein